MTRTRSYPERQPFYCDMKIYKLFIIIVLFFTVPAYAAPDEELLGKSKGYPIGTRSNWFYDESVRVGSFSNLDKIWPYNTLSKADTVSNLKRSTTEFELHYTFEGKRYSLDNYLQHQRTTGLLIIKDGEILVERYQYDRKPTDRFVSHSMAKSLVSLAVGFALADGKISSLDDKVSKYVPALTNYAYGETKIRNALRMASGVHFTENYDGKDDLTKFFLTLNSKGSITALRAFNDREAAEGIRFHYASIETQLLAVTVHAATGKNLSDYLTEKLWKPMGAEAAATWTNTPDGLEYALGNFNAVLRDYGRLGVILANDGNMDGRQILPREYLTEATDWRKHPEAFAPGKATEYFGYGYQFWTFPGKCRRFALLGVYGQAIYVDPQLKLVLVHMAVAKNAQISKETMGCELGALFYALISKYGTW